jgi:hypothetical protein
MDFKESTSVKVPFMLCAGLCDGTSLERIPAAFLHTQPGPHRLQKMNGLIHEALTPSLTKYQGWAPGVQQGRLLCKPEL